MSKRYLYSKCILAILHTLLDRLIQQERRIGKDDLQENKAEMTE